MSPYILEKQMDLKNLVSETKQVNIEYPDYPDFKITLNYLSREQLRKLRKKAVTLKINKRTREPEEIMNDELFANLYADAAIITWEGLTMECLKELVVLENFDASKAKELVPHSQENARYLMEASREFDMWVTECMNDVANFN